MSVGFMFTALVAEKEQTKEMIRKLGEESGCQVFESGDSIRIHVCCKGDIYLTLEEDEENKNAFCLTGESHTNLAGPGFHAAAIEWIDTLVEKGKLEIEMDDETEYYHKRDFQEMRKNMTSWLQSLVLICEHQRKEKPLNDLMLCWNMDQYKPMNIEDTAITPFGRFLIPKMIERVKREGIEPFAKEFFIWYEKEKDALYYRNAALNMLWEDCYFMPGSRSDTDYTINQAIIEHLEKAAELDSLLSFPKKEYLELCELNQKVPISVQELPEYQTEYQIGYRKETVVEKVGNFSFHIHGSFLYLYEEEKYENYIWYDGKKQDWHTICITAFVIRNGEAQLDDRIFNKAEEIKEWQAGDGRCRMGYAGKYEKENYYYSIGEVICGSQYTHITVSYENPKEREWAEQFFRKVYAELPKKKN